MSRERAELERKRRQAERRLHFARCTGHAGEVRAAQAQLDALDMQLGQAWLPKGLR